MNEESKTQNILSANYPNDLEQLYLSNGLSIIKDKNSAGTYAPTTFKWKEIWDDNKKFKLNNGMNNTYRAISISIPQWAIDDNDKQKIGFYKTYILGVQDEIGQSGKIEIFNSKNVIWV